MEAFAQRFRCVCLDMDGTLCTNAQHPDGHDQVLPHTAATLREYKASGGAVVVATGRPPNAATVVVDRDLPGIVSFVVCCDGGCVLAPPAEAGGAWQPIWEAGLSGACVARLLGAIEVQLPAHICHFGVQLHEGMDGFGVFGSITSSARLRTGNFRIIPDFSIENPRQTWKSPLIFSNFYRKFRNCGETSSRGRKP